MIVIPFKASHIQELATYGGQAWVAEYLSRMTIEANDYELAGPCFSATVGGEIIGCAGLVLAHEQRGIAWALLSDKAPQHFLSIHKAASRFFKAQPVARVEAYIDSEFPAARRWIKALGFSCECALMRGFLPGARDAELWTRFNG